MSKNRISDAKGSVTSHINLFDSINPSDSVDSFSGVHFFPPSFFRVPGQLVFVWAKYDSQGLHILTIIKSDPLYHMEPDGVNKN